MPLSEEMVKVSVAKIGWQKPESLANQRLATIFAKKLDKCLRVEAISIRWKERGISSVGRALQWHCRGQRFEPAILHRKQILDSASFLAGSQEELGNRCLEALPRRAIGKI